MANNRITPFVKRMRTNGGTIYTFSSAIEDIGLNINERNNDVKISYFALLNIPGINESSTNVSNSFNSFNAINGAFKYNQSSTTVKDGRVIIAESFENYALNLEANLLNRDDYNATLNRTVSERVFWKWLKETGSIRWNRDASGNWVEEEDGPGNYESVVKYVGQVSAGNVRTDTFGTYNETYILVPTSHGQTKVFFNQIEDDNYYHGLVVPGSGDGGANILGREGYTKPHPDALDYRAQYDYMDSFTSIFDSTGTLYNMTYDPSGTGSFTSGWWYNYYPTLTSQMTGNERLYAIDSDLYLDTSVFYTDLKYDDGGGNGFTFRRSNVDCISIDWNEATLRQKYGLSSYISESDMYNKIAIDDAINDNFNFNAVLIYYSIYNNTGDELLQTNLLGILFLDAPVGNSSNIGFDGIQLPSLEKIQSGPTGFGTSYSLRLNIKTDNMMDDTQAVIVDKATTNQLYAEDWNDVFYNLEKSVNILSQQNSIMANISNQYRELKDTQTQIINDIKNLEIEASDVSINIDIGTAGTIPVFTSDSLDDSSIYMKNGNVGIFTKDPSYPIEIAKNLKTKEIIIENAIRDTSGNILLGYGSPLQINDPNSNRDVSIYGNIGVTGSAKIKGSFDVDGSLLIQGSEFDPGTIGIYDPPLDDSIETIESIGGIAAGTTVGDLRGDTLSQIITRLLFPVINPTYVGPSTSISKTGGTYFEVGSTAAITITNDFNRGEINIQGNFQDYRAGEATSYSLTGPGVIGGTNPFSVSVTVAQGTSQSWSSTVNYSQGPQPLNSHGDPYGSRLSAGSLNTSSINIEGVYPLFATTSSTTTLTKQSLVSMISGNNIVLNLVAEPVPVDSEDPLETEKQNFDIPVPWTNSRPLVGIEQYNSLSGNWESVNLSTFTTSSVTQTIQGSTINYTRYTHNEPRTGDRQIRLKF